MKEYDLNKPLPIQVQLDVLIEARSNLTKYSYPKLHSFGGLCYFITQALADRYNIYVNYYQLNIIIPLFTRENATKWTTNLTNPLRGFWWIANDHGDLQRLLFLDILIQKLRAQRREKYKIIYCIADLIGRILFSAAFLAVFGKGFWDSWWFWNWPLLAVILYFVFLVLITLFKIEEEMDKSSDKNKE
jgi:hypothetical protein